jgi:hypothetical protein
VLAWLIFLFGLIAPLTPSEGGPSIGAVAVFVGGPVALRGVVAAQARTILRKVVVIVQASIILALSAWLLSARWG